MSLDTLNLDSSPDDKDEVTGDEFSGAFSSPFHMTGSTLSLNKAFVLHVGVNVTGARLAASFSNRQVNVYDATGLTTLHNLRPHEKAISGIQFSKTEPDLLLTSSIDETVKLWDLRTSPGSQPAKVFQDTSDKTKHEGPPRNAGKPIISFDTSCDSKVLAAGTEQVGHDAFLLFWDVRAGSLAGGYWESHEDDVTCVRFHPEKSAVLATGSTDGQVNLFDLNESQEDDALTCCHNTEDSVSNLHWFSKKDSTRYLAISTHTESLQLWDTDHFTTYQTFTRSDVAHGIRRTVAEHAYIVGMHEQEEQGFCILAGSRFAGSPCLRLATVKNKKLKPVAELRNGKAGSGIVRCSAGLGIGRGFITGSEDGVVSVWKPGPEETQGSNQASDGSQLKIKQKLGKRDKPY